MGLLSWIIVGLIAGWLADLVFKGSSTGLVGDILIGIVGGLLGGFLASALFGIPNPVDGFNLTSIFIAFLGALVLLMILHAVRGRRVI